jgi:alanine racemase
MTNLLKACALAYIKIDKNALFFNLDQITKKAGSKTKIAAVLKDNAYGHSIELIAPLIKEFGITKAVVRDESEAKKIEDFFDYILILNGFNQAYVCAINSLEDFKKISKGKIEIKVDTGMHRNGIEEEELEEAFKIAAKKGLEVVGVFTHYRSADILSSELFWQYKRFERVKNIAKSLAKKYGYKLHFHSQNSGALFRFGLLEDFARVGIAMYGVLKIDEIFETPPLKPVLSLWAEKISSRSIKKGQRVGYEGDFEANRDMKISTYDVGYADGLFRSARGFKISKDESILGKVSMDNVVINSTKEEIEIFNDARKLASYCDTISYEILVKLKKDLKRVLV